MASSASPQLPGSWPSECCSVCGDDTGTSQHTKVAGSIVCAACITQLFKISLRNESNFPPRWGDTVLDANEFRPMLSNRLVEKYRQKEREWGFPPTERLYCNGKVGKGKICSRFLGRRGEMQTRMEYAGCPRCWHLTCVRCLECLDLGEDPEDFRDLGPVDIGHKCSGKAKKQDDPLEGLKCGKDYQICPNKECRRAVELAAGCNHIACLCGTNYCFICATPAEELSDHWRVGQCPRYGQVGSASALYNDDIRMANADAEADIDEDGDLWRWQMQTLVEQEEEEQLRRRHEGHEHGRGDGDSHSRSPGRRSVWTHGGSPENGRRRRGLGNRTQIMSGSQVRVQEPRSAEGSQSTRKPKRGLRQIVHEGGMKLLDRIRDR